MLFTMLAHELLQHYWHDRKVELVFIRKATEFYAAMSVSDLAG